VGKLIYSAITSLDGYIADARGRFDWSMPSEEVHAFVNDVQRPIGTYLLGRRLYEVLSAWETMDDDAPEMRDYAAQWRAATKIVYSSTLADAGIDTAKTRIAREFDPHEVSELVEAGDVLIGGANLAASAFRAQLVDEVHLFVSPIIVGGGTRALPDGVTLELDLVDERRFENGVVYSKYLAN
jgi:dihydrofolate reductase